MKTRIRFAAAVALAALATSANAQSVSLAQNLAKNNCIGCHAIDKRLVGPSMKDVAKKYKGDGTAPAKLAAKIKAGGAGNWGSIPMPPQSAKDEDVRAIVKQILDLN